MRASWRTLASIGLAVWILAQPLSPARHAAIADTETRAGECLQTTVADFAAGSFEDVQLLLVQDGALSLAMEEEGYAARGVYTSSIKPADFDFYALGIQWHAQVPPGTRLEVSLRASINGTDWTPWQEVVEPQRAGQRFFALTPVIIGEGRHMQYRVTLSTQKDDSGPRLEDITITYIDSTPGPSLSELEHPTLAAPSEDGAVPQPPIISRNGWGANETYRFDGQANEIWPSEYQVPKKIIIHHSVTMNYEPNPPATVRAIYYYHAITLGWGDIGYNYLVDWQGNIYEGRYGGPDVVGGHAHDYNYGSVGICAMGTFGNTSNSVSPSSELLQGVISLSGWQCSRSLINPTEPSFFLDKTTPNIAGHRDYNATACPGDYLYAQLPSIRTQAWNMILDHTPAYLAEYLDHDTRETMLPGQTYLVGLSIRNRGTLTWMAAGQDLVRLGHRWHDTHGGAIPGTTWAPLPHDVPYTQEVQLEGVPVQAPGQPGQYILEWDLKHEDQTWFSSGGSPTLTVPVTVIDPEEGGRSYLPLVMRAEPQPSPPPVRAEARALWVPRWSYSSKEDVQIIVAKAAEANFNMLFFQVRGQGDAFYRSEHEPWAAGLTGTLGQDPGWDPLAVAVEEAHAAGLQLHAYLNVYTVWLGTTPPSSDTAPQHMYHRFNDLYGNEWVQWHQDGTPMGLNPSYLLASPGHPAVSEHIIAVCRDIVQNYDIDGLHLDYLRYAGPSYSHDPVSEQRYLEAQPIAWADWQRSQITELVRRLYDEVMLLRPEAVLSLAAWPIYQDRWGWVSDGGVKYDGYDGYYQDSRRWLQMAKMDFLAPMLYGAPVRDHPDRFRILIGDFVAESHGRHIYAGIHAGYDSFSEIESRIQMAREAGAQGQAIFAYSLVESNDYWDDFAGGPYSHHAEVPPMAWKTSLTPAPTPIGTTN